MLGSPLTCTLCITRHDCGESQPLCRFNNSRVE
jgi:hypothetical protein